MAPSLTQSQLELCLHLDDLCCDFKRGDWCFVFLRVQASTSCEKYLNVKAAGEFEHDLIHDRMVS